MADYRTKAIVLRRTNYGESDRIVQVITESGKKSLLARGVRKEKSKLAGGIELFSLSDITVHEGKGNLDILTSARLVNFYSHILEDYDRLELAYEILKDISKKSEMIESSDFLNVLREALEALNSCASLKLVRAWFYLNLAEITGDELNLSTDINGDKLQIDKTYSFDRESETLCPNDKGNISASHIKLLRLMRNNGAMLVSRVSDTEELLDTCLYLVLAVNKH
jgi:DNA repair protein RecO